ncbi:hypothetical protein T492DRAFT_881766 [Pavlovales sp. CCMP2436]|nr:hypothetical protein T492DRAFT_881766 [Pavlovales sp. CCMP2436]
MAVSYVPAADDAGGMTQPPTQQHEDGAEMIDGTQPARQPHVADRRPRLAAVNGGVENISLDMVSASHALILRQGDSYALSDANSTHGTTVNERGIRKDEIVVLRDDVIVFGMGRTVAVETYTLFTFNMRDVSLPREEVYRKGVLRASGDDQVSFLGHAGALVRAMHAAEAMLKNPAATGWGLAVGGAAGASAAAAVVAAAAAAGAAVSAGAAVDAKGAAAAAREGAAGLGSAVIPGLDTTNRLVIGVTEMEEAYRGLKTDKAQARVARRLASSFANGDLPPWFYFVFCAARCVPLRKCAVQAGVAESARPIGISCALRRGLTKGVFLNKGLRGEIEDYLFPQQLGLLVSAGGMLALQR